MNMKLFRLINNLAYKNNTLDKLMIAFSKYVPYLFMVMIAAVFIIGVGNKNAEYRKAAVNTFIMTVINLLLGSFIGFVYYENRPFVNNKVNLLFPHVEDASFPSDHATGTMSIALGLRKYNKVVSIILIVLSIIVGFSRVYVGHHYPGDVLGAYIMVIIVNYIYNAVIRDKINKLYDKAEKSVLKMILPEKSNGNI